MKTYRAELHLHTVLSPCAEIEMLPPLIVMEALEKGINLIAVTDHNATANVQAVQIAAEGSGLTVLPGMEVQTREEVHSLCLFDSLEQTYAWQAIVNAYLPDMPNHPDYFGDQLIVDSNGDFVEREERLLLNSVEMSLEQAWQAVTDLGGLFIPAHVNRKVNGLLPILGLPPADIPLEALEISHHLKPAEAVKMYPCLVNYPLIQSGDAHRLEEIIAVNQFTLESPTIQEIRLSLRGEQGRSHRILSTTTFPMP
ncbi:MAG: PHP domain-containing protein [Chloroflexota bacterium]